MKKYDRMKTELETQGRTEAKAFGNSMTPLIESGSLLTFERRETYGVGDIVFCKVKGRFIDAHKITKVNSEGSYLISNNHHSDNGWTKQIFGKVIRAVFPNGTQRIFSQGVFSKSSKPVEDGGEKDKIKESVGKFFIAGP